MGFSDSHFPNGVPYKGVMYPTVPQIAQHAFKNLFRNATLCCIVLYAVMIPLYEYIRLLPVNDAVFYVLYIQIMGHSCTFAFMVLFYHGLDYVPWAKKYKRIRKPSQQTPPELVRKSVRDAIFIHVFIFPFLVYFLITAFNQVIPRDKPVHSLPMNFFHFVGSQIVSEVGFYITHAAAHRKDMYFLHKMHHEYKGATPISMEHATYVEEIVVEFGPSVFYCVLFKVPLPVYCCWVIQRVMESVAMHSGYYFRGTFLERIGLTYAYRADFHDFHHTANRGNFSNGLFMDAFFRTMTPYLRAKQKEREERVTPAGESESLPVLRASEEVAPVPTIPSAYPSIQDVRVDVDVDALCAPSKTSSQMHPPRTLTCTSPHSSTFPTSSRRCKESVSRVYETSPH